MPRLCAWGGHGLVRLRVALACICVLTCGASDVESDSGGNSNSAWATTIDVAGRQRMLSQRMSKEFLLVAQGIEVEANRAALNRSAGDFHGVLLCMIGGCPGRNIIGAQNALLEEALQSVLDVWGPFMELLRTEGDPQLQEVRGDGGDGNVTAMATLEALSTGSLELLSTSNQVVNLLVVTAQAQGRQPSSGQKVDVAPRQRMLAQRLCKEVYALALGVHPAETLESLRTTYRTFDNSHQGLLLGAPWVGVPVVSSRCTVLMLREVTYEWERLKPLVTRVLAESTIQKSQAKAQELAVQVNEQSKPMVEAVVRAVDFYIGKQSQCDIVEPGRSEWLYLLDLVSRQGFFGQSTAHLYMEVASGVDVPAGRLELVSHVSSAQADLRSLLEGDKKKGIPSPPSQEILNELNNIFAIWGPLQGMLLEAASREVDPFEVHQVASASRQHYEATRRVAELFEDFMVATNASLNAPLVNLVEKQRKLPVKMVKLAYLVYYGELPQENAALMNETRSLFVQTHWDLLLGTPLTSGEVWEGTRDVCLVREMQTVARRFHELESAALVLAGTQRGPGAGPGAGAATAVSTEVAAASVAAAATGPKVRQGAATASSAVATSAAASGEGTIPRTLKHLVSDLEVVTVRVAHLYADLPATLSCEPATVTMDEWSSGLQEAGALRALTQRASTLYLAQQLHGHSVDITEVLADLREATLGVAFGSDSPQGTPAPLDQETMDFMWSLVGHWRAFEGLLTQAGVDVGQILEAGLRLLDAADSAVARMLARTVPGPLPAERVDTASQMALQIQVMTREALLAGSGDHSQHISGGHESAISSFEQMHQRLRSSISAQRPELLEQWTRIDGLWPPFKQQVRDVAGGADPAACLSSLATLAQQLDAATALFALPDPYVPPERPVFPYRTMALALSALIILSLACMASFYSCKSAEGDQDLQGEPSWKANLDNVNNLNGNPLGEGP